MFFLLAFTHHFLKRLGKQFNQTSLCKISESLFQRLHILGKKEALNDDDFRKLSFIKPHRYGTGPRLNGCSKRRII